ncbi:MAG: succinyl-diaminopimelate desuccinylase, partial [Alphaproteobacteria bacterium]|nr:succinyl-diaminopimelate desuccinylase [Alphaproteobacteria bacterium]
MLNLIELCQKLIRFQSTTPQDDGIMDYLVQNLGSMGFSCHLLPHADDQGFVVHNLYARRGTDSPNLCFAGHVDVVPSGTESSWTHPPFAANIYDRAIWGRGAVDMKGAIAAFISAVANSENKGSISFLITGDEEGAATHGTVKVIEWLKQHNEIIDFCIVGEPTSDEKIGDTIKVGRRGSLTGTLTVTGVQGHVAYPHKAENPIPKMLKLLTALNNTTLDAGYDHFQSSNLEITSVDVGNTASNVIPETISAKFNIRFNPSFTRLSLIEHIQRALNAVDIPYRLDFQNGSDCFLTNAHPAMDKLSQAIQEEAGISPKYSTSGGT